MQFDPNMFELHREYQKHNHNFNVGHIHLNANNLLTQSFIIMCPSCGNFKVFHCSKKISAAAEWEYAYKIVLNPHWLPHLRMAIEAHNNEALLAVFNKYVEAVKAGGYRPKPK